MRSVSSTLSVVCGEVGDAIGVGPARGVHVLLGLDEHEVVRRLAHRALDLLVALVADQDDRVALRGELLRLHVHLGHERAGGVDGREAARPGVRVHRSERPRGPRRPPSRPRAPRSPPPRRRRRARGAAPRRACCARSPCDVDGRALQLERARRSGRRGHARAVAARSGEQSTLLGAPGGQCGVRRLARKQLRPTAPCNSSDRSSRRRRRAAGHRAQVVAAAVEAGEVEVDQVDGRHPLAQERDVVVEDRGLRLGGERPPPCPTGAPRRLAASPTPERGVRVLLPEAATGPVADEVEQHHRLRVRNAARRDLASARPSSSKSLVGDAAGALLAVEEDEPDGVARARPDGPGQLGTTAVPDAPSFAPTKPEGCPSCRSGRRPRGSPGRGPARSPTTLLRPPGHGLEAPARDAASAAAAPAGATRRIRPGGGRVHLTLEEAGTPQRRRSGRCVARGRSGSRLGGLADEGDVVGRHQGHDPPRSERDLHRQEAMPAIAPAAPRSLATGTGFAGLRPWPRDTRTA